MFQPRGPAPPPDGRSKRLDIVRTLLQGAQTILLLMRISGGC